MAPRRYIRKTFVDVFDKAKNRQVRKIVPLLGDRRAVLREKAKETVGGLTKFDLARSKRGKIVSRRRQRLGHKYGDNIRLWRIAFLKARKVLRVKGFVPVRTGSKLYEKTAEFYTRAILYDWHLYDWYWPKVFSYV